MFEKDTVAIIVSIFGSVVGATWLLSGKISFLNGIIKGLEKRMEDFNQRMDRFNGRLTNIESSAKNANAPIKSQSPLSLSDVGEKYLQESGLKKYIDDNSPTLLNTCQTKKNTNAYEVQEYIFRLFDGLEFPPEIDKKLKTYAFEAGLSMEVLRRIGAIYFRDICLQQFMMDLEEIDQIGKNGQPT